MRSRNFTALPIVYKTLLSYSLKMALRKPKHFSCFVPLFKYFYIINTCLTINLYTVVIELLLLTPSAKLRKNFLNVT